MVGSFLPHIPSLSLTVLSVVFWMEILSVCVCVCLSTVDVRGTLRPSTTLVDTSSKQTQARANVVVSHILMTISDYQPFVVLCYHVSIPYS